MVVQSYAPPDTHAHVSTAWGNHLCLIAPDWSTRMCHHVVHEDKAFAAALVRRSYGKGPAGRSPISRRLLQRGSRDRHR